MPSEKSVFETIWGEVKYGLEWYSKYFMTPKTSQVNVPGAETGGSSIPITQSSGLKLKDIIFIASIGFLIMTIFIILIVKK